jgi:hypothetical protein
MTDDRKFLAAKAADFGSAIHAACEVYALEKQLPDDPRVREHLRGWVEWFDANVERVGSVEQVFVNHECGYAGRVDMVALLKGASGTCPQWAVVDFKTQRVKRGAKGEAKPAFYETWPLQLEAYRHAILASGARHVTGLVSVVIDSDRPGPVHVKSWKVEGPLQEAGWTDYFGAFMAAVTLWKYVKGYDPTHPAFDAAKPELN